MALDNSYFLVIERYGGFELKDSGTQKYISKISIDGATDIEAITDKATLIRRQ